MGVYYLTEQRACALSRVRSLLEEMLIALEDSRPGTPARRRIEAVIKGLRNQERRLEAGLPREMR